MLLLKVATVLLVASGAAAKKADPLVGFFLRTINEKNSTQIVRANSAPGPSFTHYRLLPGIFPGKVDYHFDGLASVMKLDFQQGKLSYTVKPYESVAYKKNLQCIFYASGTGPTFGLETCPRNPVVNLLPIDGQMWLTIDTDIWGRIDPDTLATIPAKTKGVVPTVVLNAHPACDPHTKDCYVQYPCGKPGKSQKNPVSNQACFGLLQTSATDLNALTISQVTIPKDLLIQHAHSPCVTPNFLVSKMDHFGPRTKNRTSGGGVLKELHQIEDNLWLVMDRRTNASKVLRSNVSFVNNHFWNCYEDQTGSVVVETVAATDEYLDTYFGDHLNKPTKWDRMFQPPQRCRVPTGASLNNTTDPEIMCTNLMSNSFSDLIIDYPTFNPLWKMRADYKFFYAIAPTNTSGPTQSNWFDRIVKIDVRTDTISKEWSAPGIYVSEADFVPFSSDYNSNADEDTGNLVSILYNSTDDTSSVAVFDAKDLKLLEMHKLDAVVPFHAHGISCLGDHCFSNP
jgi:carotenoid cleavage dioxygenase-like enzyme